MTENPVKFQKPPVNEVVIGFYLQEPVPGLRAEHIGLFWHMIRGQYPLSEQNIPLGPQQLEEPNEVFPLPRFWFKSADESRLVQFQRDALLFNWRKRDVAYPHYEEIKKDFDNIVVQFRAFCASNFPEFEPKIQRCELAYINLISNEEYFSSFDDVSRVIPTHQPPVILSIKVEHFNYNYVYRIDECTNLSVTLQSRQHRATKDDVLYFELKAVGRPDNHDDTEARFWFENAHKILRNAFDELTSKEIQDQYWVPIKGELQ